MRPSRTRRAVMIALSLATAHWIGWPAAAQAPKAQAVVVDWDIGTGVADRISVVNLSAIERTGDVATFWHGDYISDHGTPAAPRGTEFEEQVKIALDCRTRQARRLQALVNVGGWRDRKLSEEHQRPFPLPAEGPIYKAVCGSGPHTPPWPLLGKDLRQAPAGGVADDPATIYPFQTDQSIRRAFNRLRAAYHGQRGDKLDRAGPAATMPDLPAARGFLHLAGTTPRLLDLASVKVVGTTRRVKLIELGERKGDAEFTEYALDCGEGKQRLRWRRTEYQDQPMGGKNIEYDWQPLTDPMRPLCGSAIPTATIYPDLPTAHAALVPLLPL